MARARSLLTRLLVAAIVLGAFGFLFYRSVQQTRSEPYSIARSHLQGWTVTVEDPSTPSGYVVALRTRPELGSELFRQVFTRGMESLSAPVTTAVPLVTRGEYRPRICGKDIGGETCGRWRDRPDSRRCSSRDVSVTNESASPATRGSCISCCSTLRHTRAIREQIATLIDDAPTRSAFDPAAQSPVMFIAASDASYSRWLPLRVDPDTDCVAPITIN